jgi:preprotein translocase subunit YajC
MNLSLLTAATAAVSDGAETTAAAPQNQILSMLITFGPLLALAVVFWFIMIRPERKRMKVHKEMLDNLQVADEIVTAGGIIGRVLSVKDDTVLIETGGDKTRIRVLRSAITENKTMHDISAK